MPLFALPSRVRSQIRGLPGWGIGNREAAMAAFAESAGNSHQPPWIQNDSGLRQGPAGASGAS